MQNGTIGKCIFILAQDGDRSVNDVMFWLNAIGKYEVRRINDDDDITFMELSVVDGKSSFSICTASGINVDSDEIHAYWYRRGELKYNHLKLESEPNNNLYDALNNYYRTEWGHTAQYLHFLLKTMETNIIGSYDDADTNKLICLEAAKRLGFNVPKSIISNNLKNIKRFIESNKRTITKGIWGPGYFAQDSTGYESFSIPTTLYTIEDLEIVTGGDFQPTHFQEYIEKKFEVRSFYLDKVIYSMAIFSQNNEKTAIDFRNYDDERPNRIVKFKLPVEIEDKTISLMEHLGYSTGSLDFIFDGQEYYFLEVNPVGQFGWLSRYCNYYLEREIARQLTN
jgi:ATP-GRASP peptide maturase of grasp-with-spasm system